MSETLELTRSITFVHLRSVAFLSFGFSVRPAFIIAFVLFSEFVHLRRQCLVCRGQLLDGARRLLGVWPGAAENALPWLAIWVAADKMGGR